MLCTLPYTPAYTSPAYTVGEWPDRDPLAGLQLLSTADSLGIKKHFTADGLFEPGQGTGAVARLGWCRFVRVRVANRHHVVRTVTHMPWPLGPGYSWVRYSYGGYRGYTVLTMGTGYVVRTLYPYWVYWVVPGTVGMSAFPSRSCDNPYSSSAISLRVRVSYSYE